MNVLSLFDGMSCGQIALDQLGIKVDNYFAAEIDKFAIQVAEKNYPNTIHLGDVKQIRGDVLPQIDLLIGGSPCQGFSFAGKQLNFDDPRSALFFEFVRLLDETKPKYFLLENVRMKQEYQDVITEYLGVKPILINSALVSAQNRNRLYWTNIPNITQPEDRGLLLRDVLEDINEFDRTCEPREFSEDSLCHHSATATDIKGNDSIKRVYAQTGKSPTLTTMQGGHREPKVTIVPEIVKVRKHEVDVEKLQKTLREHRKPIKQIVEHLGVKKTTVEHWFRTDSSFSIPDEDVWFDLKSFLGIETDEFDKSITEFEIREGVYEMANRVYNPDYKAPTVVASQVSKVSCGRLVNRRINPETGKRDDYNQDLELEPRIEPREDDKSGCLTTVTKDNVVIRDMPDEFIQQEIRKLLGDSKYKDNFMWRFDKQGRILVMRPDGLKIQRIGRIAFPDNKSEIVTSLAQPHVVDTLYVREATKKGFAEIKPGECFDATFPNSKTRRGRAMREKSNTLMAANFEYNHWNGYSYRKLTPIECERLQTVPDNYTEGVSKSQRYKMLGNGWTVEVIKHIFKNIVE